MYQYYKGLLIREGTEGIAPELLRDLYEKIGWSSKELPQRQNEKFTEALRNSAWGFTVWDKEELVGMVRVVSDRVMVASVQNLMILFRNGAMRLPVNAGNWMCLLPAHMTGPGWWGLQEVELTAKTISFSNALTGRKVPEE